MARNPGPLGPHSSLELKVQISPVPPVVLGGALVVPKWLIGATAGHEPLCVSSALDSQEAAARACAIVIQAERKLGFEPTSPTFVRLWG